MASVAATRHLLLQALDRVQIAPDAAREAVLTTAQVAEQLPADPLYPLACYVMGRAALATEAYALAEAPLKQAIADARAQDDLELAVRAAAALDCARAPQRFDDDAAQRAAERSFAERLAAGVDRLALIAERVRLDVYRAASPCALRIAAQQARLGLGAAAVLSMGWCVDAAPQLGQVLGDQPAQWAGRLTPLLPRPVQIAGVICDVDGPLWSSVRPMAFKEMQ